ncbi:hypothetical protein SAMN05216266_1423 [Amycolatopsis marina]|uniref:Uncharacterized protein n=2 Tax=Amycolatopsis TaxID=1813 RepID=A0A1I1CV27_9PSEU|nr:hypothetical protein [Amycolatopsis roodepoortensis]TWE15006.1 hypothetical protein FHX69_7180 [Prauserella muralis]SDU62739.1 hypothetical protein SAMN04489733_7269 [Amycolatopsis keratiniphila]SFB64273.1 hypothetical protein SAMN05216266_1423 [Amycolatopsis marina]
MTDDAEKRHLSNPLGADSVHRIGRYTYERARDS